MSDQALLNDALDRLSRVVEFDPSSARPVRARCGVSATLNCGDEKALFKFVRVDPADPHTGKRRTGLVREATLLKLLAKGGDNRALGEHADTETAWTLQRWIGGGNVWEATADIRDDATDPAARRRFLSIFVDMLDGLRQIHDIGYLHGDLQPAHFVVSRAGGCRLVDFDVAVKAGAVDYEGGLVHFVSPEVAEAMTANRTDIALDVAAELYSLASVVFFLYTGRVLGWYGNDPTQDAFGTTDRNTKCMAIAAGRRRTFETVQAAPFPALEAVLSQCLAVDPTERPSGLAHVRGELAAAIDETARGG